MQSTTLSDAELATALTDVAPSMLWIGDAAGHCLFLSGALRTFWGVQGPLADFDWLDTLHPDDGDKLMSIFAQAMEDHAGFSVEARYRRADGTYRIMLTEARPRFGEDGAFLGMAGVNTDVTEQREAEQQSRYLMSELNHRTKNLMAVVLAVARATAQTTRPEEFIGTFSSRISGLASSNDLLVARNWSSVDLRDLVSAQFETLGMADDRRVEIDGPAFSVCPQHAQTLGMALHELATNSVKHGALSTAEARLSVRWQTGDDGHWSLEWREDVPHPVVEPSRKGFGHVVMVDMVQRAFDGRVDLRFLPSGVCWTLAV